MSKSNQYVIDQAIGPKFLNLFYGVYFPAYIGSLAIGLLFGNQMVGALTGKYGNLFLEPTDQIQFYVNTYLSMSILIPILIIVSSEYELKKMGIGLSPPLRKKNVKATLFYVIMALGTYFLLEFILSTTIIATRGQDVIFKSQSITTSPDFYQANIYNIISPDDKADREKILLFLSFIGTYIGIEYLLRGLIANFARVSKLGMGTAILVGAIIQATAFSNFFLLFYDWDVYVFVFLRMFIWGLVSGIIWWRTRNFWGSSLFSVVMNLLSSNSVFQRVALDILSIIQDNIQFIQFGSDFVSQVKTLFLFLRVSLILLALPSVLLGYRETIPVLKTIIRDFKFQKKGLIIVIFAFFVIDIVFSVFMSNSVNPLLLVVGFIVSIIVLRFVLPFVYMLLPSPTQETMFIMAGKFTEDVKNLNEFYPIDVQEDIEMLESNEPWYFNGIRLASIFGFLYLYLLFITAAYRQLDRLSFSDQIKYVIFMVLIPLLVFMMVSFYWARSMKLGYFFSKSWRKWLNFFFFFLLFMNIYIWTTSASTITFHWSFFPFFLPLLLTIWPTTVEKAENEFSYGLGQYGRSATFRWVEKFDSTDFEKVYEGLFDHPHEKVVSGVILLASKIELLNEDKLLEMSKEEDISRGKLIGILLGLGLVGTSDSRWLLLEALKNPDIEVKKAAYWALGKKGKPEDLSWMVNVLESNPNPELVKIAETAILAIDPNYPLAGVRDNLSIAI